MLGTIGFSYIGAAFLLMLFVPNIIWAIRKPAGYDQLAKTENKILLWLERIGQVATVVTAVMFSDFNPTGFSAWTVWLLASCLCMILYEAAWVRYFCNRSLKTFYGRFMFIPLPLAILPILAFLFLGIYGKVIWLIISVIILGIGHIGIHFRHNKSLNSEQSKSA